VNGTNPYKGLLYYLEESKKLYGTDLSNKGKHIYIIAAQCFGGQFPANLKKLATNLLNLFLYMVFHMVPHITSLKEKVK